MSQLPLQTLPSFRTVAQLQNLRAAAEQLHLTPSAVSQQIRQLEERVGVPLFDRVGRGIALNAAGRALLADVEPALDRLAAGLRAARAAGLGEAETLRLSLLPSFAQRWLLPRMARWRQRHPEWPLELHSTQQVVDLVRGGYDAALRTGNGAWPGLRAERLLHSPLIAVAAPARAARLRAAGAPALAAEPLLGPADDWRRFLALAGAELRAQPVADFNDAGLMLDAVEQDLGIALVRALLAADALQAGRLVRLTEASLDRGSGYAYWLAYPEARAGWPPLQAFRDWLLEEADAARRALEAMGVPAGPDAG